MTFSPLQRRLSLRLGLLITCIVAVVFTVMLTFLFSKSKNFVRKAAIDRAEQLLDNTVLRISGIMDETETVTNYMAITTPRHLCPDSLLAFTRRTVTDFEFLTGFAISMEPYFFPDMGRYFSAYTVRQDDTITTVREGPFEYFEKVWYKTPRMLGRPCWVDAFDDFNEGTLSAKDFLTSYCCPMRDAEGRFVGSITASLTLKWLSAAVTEIKPYPHSSAIMIGTDGTYLVHPDTAKLFRESIFSDAAPEAKRDITVMGKAMLAGRSGMARTTVDGQAALIFYRPLERTGWSIAIVCPESDVFSRYNQLLYTVWTIICIGLIALLLFCYQTVRRAVQPLKLLAEQTQRIANGQFDETIPPSPRYDSVGQLQNSFMQMQQFLAGKIAELRSANDLLAQRNAELVQANLLANEANKRKTAFVQDMAHQIRTPLNIINGFTQVLAANFKDFPEEELRDITQRMKSSTVTIHRIVTMLAASAASDAGEMPNFQFTTFACNEACREVINALTLHHPDTVEL